MKTEPCPETCPECLSQSTTLEYRIGEGWGQQCRRCNHFWTPKED